MGIGDPTYDGFTPENREARLPTAPPRGRGETGRGVTQIKETWGDTPKTRPLPTLHEIHQINLRRALEEERADTPCDICGDPDHDYRHCQAGARVESQGVGPELPPEGQNCRNCDKGHKGQCPCGWCGEYGHISVECPAKYNSQSMRDRFPKKKKAKRQKVMEYTCRRCGDKHPFNRYCPHAVGPSIVPGECRSCATLTNVHEDWCEMVAIKDRIGLCAFCGDVSHAYTKCPERYPNRAPKRVMGRTIADHESARAMIRDRAAPGPPVYYGVCSFCGSAGHGHEECPRLKEAIQEQAAQLVQLQIARYEAARVTTPKEAGEQVTGTGGRPPYPQGKGTASGRGGGLSPGGGDDSDPDEEEGSSSRYSEGRKGLHPFRGSGGGGDPPDDPDPDREGGPHKWFRGRHGPRGYSGPPGPMGPRGPRDRPEGRETRGQPQGWQT